MRAFAGNFLVKCCVVFRGGVSHVWWCRGIGFDVSMSPYSRYRPLPGSDGLTVLQTPPRSCRSPTPTAACKFLRWFARLSPQPVNKQAIGEWVQIVRVGWSTRFYPVVSSGHEVAVVNGRAFFGIPGVQVWNAGFLSLKNASNSEKW